MTENEIIRKNLDLHAEWMKYVFEHPDTLDKIPPDAHLVIIPNDDAAMANENLKTARNFKNHGETVAVVRINSPKPIEAQLEVA